MNDTQTKTLTNPLKASTSLNKIPFNIPKIGEARFPVALFDVPDALQIISMRTSPKRDLNGIVIENTIDKIQCEVVGYNLLQMVIKSGGNQSNLATITMEYIADEAIMKGYKAEDLIGKIIDIRQAEVGLKWVQRGASGSWGGFKLICSMLKFVQLPTNQPTE